VQRLASPAPRLGDATPPAVRASHSVRRCPPGRRTALVLRWWPLSQGSAHQMHDREQDRRSQDKYREQHKGHAPRDHS